MALFGSCVPHVWLGLCNLPLRLLVACPIVPCCGVCSWFLLPGLTPLATNAVALRSWATLVSPGVNGVLRTWGGSMSRYPMAGGVTEEGLLLACVGAACMGRLDLSCEDASVGTRVRVCLCARDVVSVMHLPWLLVFASQ